MTNAQSQSEPTNDRVQTAGHVKAQNKKSPKFSLGIFTLLSAKLLQTVGLTNQSERHHTRKSIRALYFYVNVIISCLD